MKLTLVLSLFLFAAGCQTAPKGPDPALFPERAQEYNDGYGAGFRKGFSEGLAYNLISQ